MGLPEGSTFTFGDIGWYESVAVSYLTKVLLKEVSYEEVELLGYIDVDLLFEGEGDQVAFQDVWLPRVEAAENARES